MSRLRKIINKKQKIESRMFTASKLKKIAGMTTLYHGTTVEDFKNITRDGKFIPNKSDNGARQNIKEDSDRADTIGFTYFANSWHLAESYAELASDNGMASGGGPDVEVGVVLTLELPEEMLLADTWNSSSSVTWQESWDSTGQVKVKGEVSVDYITEVELLDPKTFETIYQGPFNGWLEEYEKLKPELEFSTTQDIAI